MTFKVIKDDHSIVVFIIIFVIFILLTIGFYAIEINDGTNRNGTNHQDEYDNYLEKKDKEYYDDLGREARDEALQQKIEQYELEHEDDYIRSHGYTTD